jgi:site-specific DNA recombinase
VLYKLLKNRTYIGDAVHKGVAYPGEHEAIIDRKLWDRVQAIIQESPRKRGASSPARTPALLKGLIFDAAGVAMSPTHTRRKGRLYRYYVSQRLIKAGEPPGAISLRVPAGEIEEIVIGQFRRMVASPEVIAATWKQLRGTSSQLTENEVRAALVGFDEVWAELFPPLR